MNMHKYIDLLYTYPDLKRMSIENVKIILEDMILENERFFPSLISLEASQLTGAVKSFYKYMNNSA